MRFGIFTPFAASLVGILANAVWNSAMFQPNLLASELSLALVFVVAASVALLGTGAFSVDACIFGLREIIVPRRRLPATSTKAAE